ncbi:Hypothetical protein CINCED_3A014279 [Cinara cedri]|uniref:Uncharacterized protein n=1 Tax=Cinara cedri TaxID=506608 RepID=A0A5E4NPC6_9HEMI|nr:Hypothetical protein CINCED_3A014279 [Cinara cedri]
MSQTSIKIECIHILANNLTEKLGYVLLRIKEAQTVNLMSNDQMENKSYKLIGSKKNCNYSLIMSLTIEDCIVKKMDSKKPPTQIKHLKITNNLNDKINDLEKEENDHFEENDEINLPKNDVNMLEQTEHLPAQSESVNVFSLDVQKKYIDELENWKDKQMILFIEKLKIKEEQLFKEFNKNLLDDRNRIQEHLSNEILECKALAENVDKMVNKLKERGAIITAKELEFACQKDSIDNKYNSLVQNMISDRQAINELNIKIIELTTKLHDSEKKNILIKQENKQLKNDFNTNCSFQIQHLKNKIVCISNSNLESKYAKANQSSMFYKDLCITYYRKINQMYSTYHGSKTNGNLVNQKQNVQNIFTNQFVDQQQDDGEIKQLLNKLR